MSGFIEVADNPAPAGAQRFTLSAPDGAALNAAFFETPDARGTFILLTGWSEFIEKYFETVRDLQARGFSVIMMDWRGQGRSERLVADQRLSYIDDFARFRGDLLTLLEEAGARGAPQPYYLMTHSMGGAPALQLLANGDGRFKAAILCAPLTRLSENALVESVYRGLAGAMSAIGLGKLGLPGGDNGPAPFDDKALTSDPRRHELFVALQTAAPEAAVRRPTFGWLHAAMAAMDDLHQSDRFVRLKTPVLIISAGRDRLVSSEDHARLAERSPLIERTLIADARHEILMERDDLRAAYWSAVDDFRSRRAGVAAFGAPRAAISDEAARDG